VVQAVGSEPVSALAVAVQARFRQFSAENPIEPGVF
jgi:hypothetical protein